MTLAVPVTVLAAILVLYAALTSQPGTITLSGPAAQYGQVAPMAVDTRTHRAFIITGAAIPGLPPPRHTRSHLDILDTTSGTLLRSVSLGPAPTGLAIDDQAGRVFVADMVDGTVRVLDAGTGVPVHTVSLAPLTANSITVDARLGRAFVASTLYNAVQTFDARSGTRLHTVRDAGNTLVVDEQTGRVFAFIADNGGSDNPVTVLDGRSGGLLHTILAPQAPTGIAVGAGHAVVTMSAAVTLVSATASVLVLDGRTGRTVHTLPVQVPQRVVGRVGGLLVMVDDALANYRVGNQHLSLLDPRTGHITHMIALGPGSHQVVEDPRHGFVFAAGLDANGGERVWTIEARSGAVLRTNVVAGLPTAMALDRRRGRVFVATAMDRVGNPSGPGSVTVLDARGGRVLRTIRLLMGPIALLSG